MRRPRNHGTTLVEVLVALAVTATLMLAIGAALFTLVRAHRINEQNAITMAKARLVLNSMLHRMRMTGAIQPHDDALLDRYNANDRKPQVVHGKTVDGGILDKTGAKMSIKVAKKLEQLADDDPQKIGQLDFDYEYNASKHELTLKAQGGKKQLLMNNVTDFEVRFYPTRSPEAVASGGPYDVVEQITVKMTVEPSVAGLSSEGEAAQTAITVYGSAVPRSITWNGRHTDHTIEELSGNKKHKEEPGF